MARIGKEDIWIPTEQPSTAFCRICVSVDDGGFHTINMINQPSNAHNGANSLQMMMEMLFPSVFSEEQLRSEQSINWPTRICQDCKRKVLEAYSLYELCVASTDRLRKMLTEDCAPSVVLGNSSHMDFLLDTPTEYGMKEENTSEILNKPCLSLPIKNSGHELIKSQDRTEIGKETQEYSLRTRLNRTCMADLIKSSTKSDYSKQQHSGSELKAIEEDGRRYTSRQYEIEKPAKERCKARQKKIIANTGQKRTANDQTKSADTEVLDQSETKSDQYRCQLCDGPTYGCPTELTQHLKAEHPDQIRSCSQCPKVFMSEQTLQHHQYCHATGRSHFCMFCDKGFQKQNLLANHIRTHTKRGDFLCSLCGKEFTNHTNLRQHAKIKHSGEKPWACTLCPSRFTTKGTLKMHQFTHTKVKKFSCETCGTQFTKHSSLVKHRLIHTGERPFVCEVCKMRFISSYMLKRHMLTHTGEKPFKCTYCERSFAQSNDMVKHLRTHVGDNLYKCDRCDASYRLLSELRNHYTEHYQSGDGSVGCSTLEEDKNIRFTTTYIMKLRMDKERSAPGGSRVEEFSSTL